MQFLMSLPCHALLENALSTSVENHILHQWSIDVE